MFCRIEVVLQTLLIRCMVGHVLRGLVYTFVNVCDIMFFAVSLYTVFSRVCVPCWLLV